MFISNDGVDEGKDLNERTTVTARSCENAAGWGSIREHQPLSGQGPLGDPWGRRTAYAEWVFHPAAGTSSLTGHPQVDGLDVIEERRSRLTGPAPSHALDVARHSTA